MPPHMVSTPRGAQMFLSLPAIHSLAMIHSLAFKETFTLRCFPIKGSLENEPSGFYELRSWPRIFRKPSEITVRACGRDLRRGAPGERGGVSMRKAGEVASQGPPSQIWSSMTTTLTTHEGWKDHRKRSSPWPYVFTTCRKDH